MTGFPLDAPFKPRRWLRSRHFQTILPSLLPRRARVERRAVPLLAASEELLLDCGDGVTLQAFHSSPTKRGREPGKKLAVLLHGWEGSSESTYLLSMAQSLFAEGHEVVRLNLRDHGATHHLNRDLFHSCRLPKWWARSARWPASSPGLRWCSPDSRWAGISCCAWRPIPRRVTCRWSA